MEQRKFNNSDLTLDRQANYNWLRKEGIEILVRLKLKLGF